MLKSNTWIPVRDDRVEVPSIDRAAMFLDMLEAMEIETAGRSVVDLGAGFGSISIALAQRGSSVLSIDASEERVLELQRRAAMQQLTLDAHVANLLDPPMRTGEFDVALLVGVVEYAGLWSDSERVEELQERVLRYAYDSLKPGGSLVLCTKNRTWPVFAVRDVHTGKPLLNVLPRRAAEWASQRFLGEPYRRYIHTPRVWGELVERAGFTQVKAFVPYFSYQYPVKAVRQPSFGDIGDIRPNPSHSAKQVAITHGRAWRLKAAFMALASTVGLPFSQSIVIRATKV